MCLILKEEVAFPFPELPGAPGGLGEITIHASGAWHFDTVEGRFAVSYFVFYEDGIPKVGVDYRGEM